MSAARDQNDRLRDGTLPADPFDDAVPVAHQSETRVRVAKAVGASEEPNDAQAEATLLGTLLWCGANAPDALSVTSVVDLVPTPDVFMLAEHQRVFAAIIAVVETSKPVDVVTVHSELVRQRAGVGIDALERLASIAEEPSVARARAYAQSVRDAWLRRRAIAVANDVIASCRRGEADAGTVVATAIESLRPIGEAVVGDACVTSLLASAKEIAADMATGKAVEYWPTGFRDLDLILGGLYPLETTLIAARTSVGKTMCATQVTQFIVEHTPNTAALYVTLEMPAKSFTRRLIASRARIDGRHLRRNTLSPLEVSKVMGAAQELARLPIYFAQSQSQTIMSIHAMAQATARMLMLKGQRLALIVIDHVGLVKPSDMAQKRSARHEQVAETSRGLRFLAERHGCHVIGLSQIKREVESRKGADKMPGLSDLKDSGSLEDDADNVLILHRPRDEMKQLIDGPAWVSVAKGRNDGTGLFQLGVEREIMRFHDWNG